MLIQRKEIPELYKLKHRHDDFIEYVEYENQLFTSTMSPYMFGNPIMSGFLLKMQSLASLLFDQMTVMQNFKNYIVDKYHYKQSR